MKKIKFRAWYANQEMHYGIAPIDNEYYIFFETQKINAHDLQINRAISIMQYTGLKDKNGKEIYEGDIVRGKYGKNGIVKNYEIRWLIGHFAAVDRNNITGDEHYYPIGLLEGEVIGNIFQDGDLLRDSQNPDRNRIYENSELIEGETK